MTTTNNQSDQFLIIGGGAAGFFAAIAAAEASSGLQVAILEKGKDVLQKVKVSGGGRCNVTHACFDPTELVKFYPRGGGHLLGPFQRFGPRETVAWFEKRGVRLKTEADGRMFPVSDRSQTIIDCLWKSAKQAGVQVLTGQNVTAISPPKTTGGNWLVKTQAGLEFTPRKLMVATGSSPRIWQMLADLGHQIVPPVPSLFTFNIRDPRLADLAGISVPDASVHISGEALRANGPLLVTHWGLSGPGILRLSAWGARRLHELGYRFELAVNWLGDAPKEQVLQVLRENISANARKQLGSFSPFGQIPRRLWEKMLAAAGASPTLRWAEFGKQKLGALGDQICAAKFQVDGKSTFKEEFVTAGGVALEEVDFQRFESKIQPGLFLAGEVLDIDAITGGFNFQAAWTGGVLMENGEWRMENSTAHP